MVPTDEEAFMRGPSAVVQYVAAGGLPTMPMALGMGFVHFLLSALLIGYGLKAVGGDFSRQARVVVWFGLAASVFMHLGDPIWYGLSWRASLFEFVCRCGDVHRRRAGAGEIVHLGSDGGVSGHLTLRRLLLSR